MLVLPLIPFFLGYKMSDVYNPTPSYVFFVRVDTLFFNKSETLINKEGNAGLEFYLKCQSYNIDSLKCHIPKIISYTPSTDPAHMVDNNFFKPSPLTFKMIRFKMEFDVKGVKNYHYLAANVRNMLTVFEVYQFIGDQLSVGADLMPRDFEFDTMENSVIGNCPTHYKIIRDKPVNINDIELVSLIMREDYKLIKDEVFNITKQRRVDECYPQHSYILGRILFTDLIPSNVTAKPQESQTLMSFGQKEYYSKTVNTFQLYNEQDEFAGCVRETINVGLDFIEG